MHPSTEIPAEVAAATQDQRTRFAGAYSILERAIAERAFPGAAFGVIFDGRVVALDGVGRFTYDVNSPAVSPASVYDLASVTKVVATTAMAMLLHDRGQLDLEQPIGEVLPGFVIGSLAPLTRCRVTFHHLLAHTSGLPAYARLFEIIRTPDQLVSACLQMPLEAAPGERAEYSDIGFILLGKALEIMARESLDEYCSREVFVPLSMTSARYKPPHSWRDSTPPTVEDAGLRGRVIQGEVHDENCFVLGGVSGHAGLFANPLDVLRYASCILSRGGTTEGRPLFGAETIDLFATRHVPPVDSSRALGWDTPSGESSSGRYFSPSSIGHLGYTGTSLWIDRERGVAVTLLTNRTWPDGSSHAIREVRPLFHDAVVKTLSS